MVQYKKKKTERGCRSSADQFTNKQRIYIYYNTIEIESQKSDTNDWYSSQGWWFQVSLSNTLNHITQNGQLLFHCCCVHGWISGIEKHHVEVMCICFVCELHGLYTHTAHVNLYKIQSPIFLVNASVSDICFSCKRNLISCGSEMCSRTLWQSSDFVLWPLNTAIMTVSTTL